MKKIVFILLMIITGAANQIAYGQGWVIDVTFYFNYDQGCSNVKINSATLTYAGYTANYIGPSATNSITLSFNGPDPEPAVGPMQIVYTAICEDGSPYYFGGTLNFNYTRNCAPPFYIDGSTDSDPYSSVNIVGFYQPRMEISSVDVECDQVTLYSNSPICTGTYGDDQWEVTETPGILGSWQPLPVSPLYGFKVTPDMLAAVGLPKYGKKFYHVTIRPETTSAAEEVSFFACPPTATLVGSDPTCFNGSDGSINVNISSPEPDIDSFLITLYRKSEHLPVGTNYLVGKISTLPGLDSGTYRLHIENNKNVSVYGNASVDYEITLGNPIQVQVALSSPQTNGFEVKCFGGNDGSITATGSGGAGGYKNYSWTNSNGQTTQTASGLTAGPYTASLTDSKGCPASNSITLKAPVAITAPITSTNLNGAYDVSCSNSSNGAVRVDPTGDIGGYTYLWGGNQTTQTLSSLAPGTYSVTVTDANTCTGSGSIILTAPPAIDFNIDQITGLTCAGDLTSSYNSSNLIHNQGTPIYAWSTLESSPGISNKGAGTYSLTITDPKGCSTTKSVSIADPLPYSVAVNPLSDFNGEHIKCHGDANGVLEAIVKNESNVVTAAQLYEWKKDGSNFAQGPTLNSLNSLEKGSYEVTITYNTICKAKSTYALNEPTVVSVIPNPTTDYHGQKISCRDSTDANLKATAGGGTIVAAPYTYTWNTGATGSLLSGVGHGNYQVTATDNNGCTGTNTITLVNPDAVEASIISVSDYNGFGVSCNGFSNGNITAVGAGGTTNFTYLWSNGKTTAANNLIGVGVYNVIVADENGCRDTVYQEITSPMALSLAIASTKNISCHGGKDGKITLTAGGGVPSTYKYSKDGINYRTTNNFDSLMFGNFTLTLKDANGCSTTTSTSLTEPSQLDIQFTNVEPAFCKNPQGKATAIVNGGVTSYSYSWKDSQSNIVSLSDKLTNAKGDIYTLTIQDGNNCLFSAPVAITSTDGAKSDDVSTDAKCFDSADGSSLITITAGDGPFVIEWPDGQSTLQGINLRRGSYYVKITDVNTCTVIQNVIVSSPQVLQLSKVNETIPTCHDNCDGVITLQGIGGMGGYLYDWNGNTTAVQTQLCAGTYMVKLKDANQCELDEEITLSEPDAISLTVVNETTPTCAKGCDGSLTVLASGGNGGYQYNWNQGSSGNMLQNICPNNYSISITDQKGCEGTGTATLHDVPPVVVNLGGGVTLCVGQKHNLDAGVWPSINWTSNTGFTSTDQKIIISEPGSYWLKVLNADGCVGQDTFLLETSFDLLKASFLIPQEAIVEDTVVMIDVSWPMPELTQWVFPADMKKVLDLDDVIFGQFNDAGDYEVSMTAHLGECVDEVTKKIHIIERSADGNGGRLGYESFVKRFTLYSNPNDGSFTVQVILQESSNITLSVWSGPSGVLVNKQHSKDKSEHSLNFDLRPLSPGTYVLRLDHERGKEYVRFVVY